MTVEAVRYGVAVDVALHAPHPRGDERNFHAHLLSTTRTVTATGLGGKSSIEWSDADRRRQGLPKAANEIEFVRAHWAELTNAALRVAEHTARVDHRSLAAQGIERAPTQHRGPAITALERRGIRTELSWRLEAEATQRLERAAELGRREREAAPAQTSRLSLESNLAAARAAREAQTAVALRAKADQALAEWQQQKSADPAASRVTEADHTWEHDRTTESARPREPDRSLVYDPWDLSL